MRKDNRTYIPDDFTVNHERQIVRSLFNTDVYDWPGQMLNLPEVHKKYTGKGVTIGVLDTGYYGGHPDLDDDIMVKSFTEAPDLVGDDNGHGTHVRGIINMQKNGEGLVGVAPGAKVHVGKIMVNGFGAALWSARGIHWCIDQGFDIICGSFGMRAEVEVVKEAVDRAEREGVICVFASGNESAVQVLYPARHRHAIAVGAVDSAKMHANFSNIGANLNLVAPGVNIKSSWIDGEYREASGTSMATPIVAGIIALYIEKMRRS